MSAIIPNKKDFAIQTQDSINVDSRPSLDNQSIEQRLSKLESEIANLKKYKVKEVAILTFTTYGVVVWFF